MFTIRIKALRESLNMNKREFSEALNLPYTTYNNYETGTREPNSDVLISIAKKFEVSVDWLIGNDGGKEKAPTQSEDQARADDDVDAMVEYLQKGLVATGRLLPGRDIEERDAKILLAVIAALYDK